jgi:hypothetical protein
MGAHSTSRAFTLVELLVVVAVLMLLIAILLPTLRQARELGRAALCSTHVHRLSTEVHYYAGEHNSCLPWGYNAGNPDYNIVFALLGRRMFGKSEYVVGCPPNHPNTKLYCPSFMNSPGITSRAFHSWGSLFYTYSYVGAAGKDNLGPFPNVNDENDYRAKMHRIDTMQTGQVVMFFDGGGDWGTSYNDWIGMKGDSSPRAHHLKFFNISFFDGHNERRQVSWSSSISRADWDRIRDARN